MDETGLIENIVFDSGKPGPSFLVLGAVHGDGTAGTKVLREIIDELQDGRMTLKSGRLIAVPVVNRRAYDLGQRNAGESLNRICEHHAHPHSHEGKVANELLSLIDQCDVLLDVHSCHPLDKPFVFIDHDTRQNRFLAAATGLNYVCTGWNQLYERLGWSAPGPADYADSRGKTAAVLECGWHDDPAAVEVARRCINNCLVRMGMIDGVSPSQGIHDLQNIKFEDMVIKDREGTLTRAWKHMDPIHKNDVIAEYTDGGKVVAPYDGYILFPFPDAVSKNEWFYLGREDHTLVVS